MSCLSIGANSHRVRGVYKQTSVSFLLTPSPFSPPGAVGCGESLWARLACRAHHGGVRVQVKTSPHISPIVL